MPENTTFTSDRLTTITRGQAVVEARQPVPDGNILCVTAVACATPSEIFAGEVRYTGKVDFSCLVACADGIKCITAVAEFSDKITSPAISADTPLFLVPEVINTEASMDGGTLKAVAVVDTSVVGVTGEQYSCICPPIDGVFTQTATVDYCRRGGYERETAYITDSIAAEKVDTVLCSTSRAVVTEASAADGEVKVSGAVYTTAITSSGGEIGSIRVVTPFVKSVPVQSAKEGDGAFAQASVTSSSVELDSGAANIAVTLDLYAITLSRCSCEIVTDAFCPERELEKKECTLAAQTTEQARTVIDTVDGQIPIPPDQPAADTVLCVGGTFVTITSATVENGRTNVEGLVGGEIVYGAEGGSAHTAAFRIPFSIPLPDRTECSDVRVSGTVTDVTVKIRRESVFDIKAEVAFTVTATADTIHPCVSDIVLGEPIAKPDATVIIHIAKTGETLWQAAKALGCSPERVSEQNSASPPYIGGERLINFCAKK